MRYKSNHVTENDIDVNEDTPREYFCSELVAKAYKVLGILKD